MAIPNRERALVERRKLTEYLLSSRHPVGRFKCRFFFALGYQVSEPEVLESDLIALLETDPIDTIATEFGTKYVVVGELTGPNGAGARVRSVWFLRYGDDVPRFVTAYPEK